MAAGASRARIPGLRSIPSSLSLISKNPCLRCGASHLLTETPLTQKPRGGGGPPQIILSALKKNLVIRFELLWWSRGRVSPEGLGFRRMLPPVAFPWSIEMHCGLQHRGCV